MSTNPILSPLPRFITVIAMIGLFLALPDQASANTARDVITRFSTDLRSLDGRFVQQVFNTQDEAIERSEGRISLKAPRQFRWEYQQPFPQLIVADGDHIWLYDPDLEQVTVRVQSFEEQVSPLAALIDPGELDRQFIVREGGQAQGLTWVDLKARNQDAAAVQSAKLGFDTHGLSKMVFEDQLGQRTEVSFSAWTRNGALPADLFRFTPPEGVDVVGDTLDSAEVRPLQE